jgi:hypothetical protein
MQIVIVLISLNRYMLSSTNSDNISTALYGVSAGNASDVASSAIKPESCNAIFSIHYLFFYIVDATCDEPSSSNDEKLLCVD